MNYTEIQFPLEGNVQQFVHFADACGGYKITFASPYCYQGCEEYLSKKAFLLGFFDQFRKATSPQEVYSYYTLDEKTKPCGIPGVRAAIRTAEIFDSENNRIGSVDSLLDSGFIRLYRGLYPNRIYDNEGKCVAFCAFRKDEGKKYLYTFEESFVDHLEEELTADKLKEYEQSGVIQRVYGYELVHLKSDAKSALEALFSSSKKSELTNHRIRQFSAPSDETQAKLFLTALFAYVWTTYIDSQLA